MNDGLAQASDKDAFIKLDQNDRLTSVLWYVTDLDRVLALTGIENKADSLEVIAIRPDGIAMPRRLTASAYDDKGRRIAEAPLTFAVGSNEGRPASACQSSCATISA